MNAARALLVDLRGKGVRVSSAGDRLKLNMPVGVITPDLRARLIAAKSDLLALLASEGATAANDRSSDASPDVPAHIRPLLDRGYIWRIPVLGGPDRFISAGPDDDLRQHCPEAIPMFRPGFSPTAPPSEIREVLSTENGTVNLADEVDRNPPEPEELP